MDALREADLDDLGFLFVKGILHVSSLRQGHLFEARPLAFPQRPRIRSAFVAISSVASEATRWLRVRQFRQVEFADYVQAVGCCAFRQAFR